VADGEAVAAAAGADRLGRRMTPMLGLRRAEIWEGSR